MIELFRLEKTYENITDLSFQERKTKAIKFMVPVVDKILEDDELSKFFFNKDNVVKCINTIIALISEGGGTYRFNLNINKGAAYFSDLEVEGSKITFRILINK
jgi:hypothetical protein